MTFSGSAIFAMAIGALLGFIIPIGAVIIFKLISKKAWLPAAFIGAGTFFVFALILERLLHMVMLPLVQDSAILYTIYGALAAGVFEETGRFLTYKLVMKKHLSTPNAVMLGLGHGGFEAIIVLGVVFLNYIIMAVLVNSQGYDAAVAVFSAGNPETAAVLETQFQALVDIDLKSVLPGVFERLIAMVFHVCMSVIVYHSVTKKGKLWFFPMAILLHALLDVPAALYQTGVITSIPVVHAIMTVFTALIAGLIVIFTKKNPDSDNLVR